MRRVEFYSNNGRKGRVINGILCDVNKLIDAFSENFVKELFVRHLKYLNLFYSSFTKYCISIIRFTHCSVKLRQVFRIKLKRKLC